MRQKTTDFLPLPSRLRSQRFRPTSHETLLHTILRLKDIFGTLMSIGQGKLLAKNQGILTKNKSRYVFVELTLVGH